MTFLFVKKKEIYTLIQTRINGLDENVQIEEDRKP
jgi:hypothetical protein